ncbi:uncharacterized protein TNCV_958981 [Trichonephila clavipes]|nr:uncharacterized protein TNCV_958981 [Trichonephila clavipes]
MKQKQTKNKHSGSARARSDQWTMDMQNRLKITLEEGLGIRDDPVLHERDQAIEIFKETAEFEKGRYIVQLPFRKSYDELSDNYLLAKQRFQNLWRRFGHDSELYQQYREIIHDNTEQGIMEEVKTETTDNELNRPVYYLPHQAIECNSRLCSDIKQAFLQISLADEHKDAVRFLWSDDEPCAHKRPKLQVFRFNRVYFGVSSSPFLLAATITHHIEKYKHEFPDTVELLDRNFYVDDLISGGNEFEEALQTSRRSNGRKNFNVHRVHETVSLVANATYVLGLSWDTNEDYLTTDTKSLLEFVSLDKNTKRFILQAVGKIFDPLGLISPFTVRMKCLLQDLWKEEIQWDNPLPTHNEKEWKKWSKYFVSENIDWKFIPPTSLLFGGLWETGVKSVKHHLKREIGNHLTFEEFESIMIQVEGILNSRPLTLLSSDADNFDVLTPCDFLIGRSITPIPVPNLIDVNENLLSRWEKITKVVQRTWKKWKSHYLNTLQARSKWITEKMI